MKNQKYYFVEIVTSYDGDQNVTRLSPLSYNLALHEFTTWVHNFITRELTWDITRMTDYFCLSDPDDTGEFMSVEIIELPSEDTDPSTVSHWVDE